MAKWMHLSWRPTPYNIGNVVRSLTLILNLVKQSKLKRTVPSLQREDAVEEPEERRKMDENGWMFRGC